MKNDKLYALNCCMAIFLLLVLLTALVGCSSHPIVGIPTKPNFAPVRAAVTLADTAARDTSVKAGAVVARLAEHSADTQPAGVVVAEVMPLAQATTQAASATVEAVAAVGKSVDPVETQTNQVYASAVTNHDSATHYQAAYTKERNSWFGGKIGHWLEGVLILGLIVLVLWIVSKVALSAALPTGWINLVLLPIHVVGNLAETAANLVVSAAKAAWSGLVWFYNEIVLKHIPWPVAAPAQVVPPPVVPT